MTEREWRSGYDLFSMRDMVERMATPRKRRLVICARCRVLDLVTDPNLDAALRSLEQFADDAADRTLLDDFDRRLRVAEGAGSSRLAPALADYDVAVRRWMQVYGPEIYGPGRVDPDADVLSEGARFLSALATREQALAEQITVALLSFAPFESANPENGLTLLDGDSDNLVRCREEAPLNREMAGAWAERAAAFSEAKARQPNTRELVREAQLWADESMRELPQVAARRVAEAREQVTAGMARMLKDIVGNPFRPVALHDRWRTSDVVGLARGIYDDRAFDRLPILADALIDAGCDETAILDHCREPGPHYRGCWVVDLVLGLR
jgi:hypothetical protein